MTERWLPVVGYEGWYDVSNAGRIRRTRSGGSKTYAGKILSGAIGSHGYPTVLLCKGPSNTESACIHHLVAEAFLGPRPRGFTVNHDDGIKTNNRITNLEYLSMADNIRHAFLSGLQPIGSNRTQSKLNETKVAEIRRLLPTMSNSEIARMYGVTRSTIRHIRIGKSWKHVKAE